MAKPKKKPTDWEAVRAAYNAEYADTGTCALDRLAEKFGVNYGTLRNHSSAENWREDAEKMRAEVVKKTAQLAVPVIAKHRVEVMEKHLTFLAQVRQVALNQIGEAMKAKQLALKDAIKLVFDSLRMEKLLHDMVADGPTASMSEDEIRQQLFADFAKRMEAEFRGEGQAPSLPKPN